MTPRRKQIIAVVLLAMLSVPMLAAVVDVSETDAYTTSSSVSGYTYDLSSGGTSSTVSKNVSWADATGGYNTTIYLSVSLSGSSASCRAWGLNVGGYSWSAYAPGGSSGAGTFTKTASYYCNDAYLTSLSITYTVREHAQYTTYYSYSASLQFDVNGGTDAPDTVTASKTSTSLSSLVLTVPSGQPVWSGHAFLGWATAADAATAAYQAGDTVTVPHDGTVTLYAIWQITTVTVTFQPDNAETAAVVTVTAGGPIGDWPADPAKDGCVFTGWYSDEDCTTLYDTSAAVTDDITLYAGYTTELVFTSTPTASACVTVSSVYDNAISVSAAGSSGYTSVLWNFGDGSTSASLYTTHVYASSGDYTVTLTVTNDAGSDTVTQTVTASPVPTADSGRDSGTFTVLGITWYWMAVIIVMAAICIAVLVKLGAA